MSGPDQPPQSFIFYRPKATSESSCLIRPFDLTTCGFVRPKSPAAFLAAVNKVSIENEWSDSALHSSYKFLSCCNLLIICSVNRYRFSKFLPEQFPTWAQHEHTEESQGFPSEFHLHYQIFKKTFAIREIINCGLCVLQHHIIQSVGSSLKALFIHQESAALPTLISHIFCHILYVKIQSIFFF